MYTILPKLPKMYHCIWGFQILTINTEELTRNLGALLLKITHQFNYYKTN